LASKVPVIVRAVAPAGALDLYEEVGLVGVYNSEKESLELTYPFRHKFRLGTHILIVKQVIVYYNH
jgi:hypothetical protein